MITANKASPIMNILKTVLIDLNTVHIWRASTVISEEEEQDFSTVLSADEMQRADRFYFPIHRRRYIATRGMLRHILEYYLGIPAAKIVFLYSQLKKPYLAHTDLQFNISHSHDAAVFAFTQKFPLGVDIEKIEPTFKESVAERYFSTNEFSQLMKLPKEEQIPGFYRIWSRKEALVKALGAGLHFPLKLFSVALQEYVEQLHFEQGGYSSWHLESFSAYPEYQSAFATPQLVLKILYWDWTPQGPVKWT
jgi:4'-phosphopantetheinyl transferase